MITDSRPLKAVVYERPHWSSRAYLFDDAFNLHTRETVAVDWWDGEPFSVVESCDATWSEKDGTMQLDTLTGRTGWERSVKVRCLEPATWYVKIPVAGGGGSYCQFHKPMIVSL